MGGTPLFTIQTVLRGQYSCLGEGTMGASHLTDGAGRHTNVTWIHCSHFIQCIAMKKRSHKEWRHLIRAEFKGKGGNRHCSATCPIWFISYDVAILSSDTSTSTLGGGESRFSHQQCSRGRVD